MNWSTQPYAAFDTETTGVDVETARIVTAAFVVVSREGVVSERTWLVDPGVEIPAEATAVHGITTERARNEGQSATAAVSEILGALSFAFGNGMPVAAFNACYDLTVVQRESDRHQLMPLHDPAPVICPLTIDRALDRYPKGKRTLVACCETYGVRQDGTHTATGDAFAAARVAWALARRYPAEVAIDAMALHRQQQEWHRAWAASFEEYLTTQGKPERIPREWPVRPRMEAAA